MLLALARAGSLRFVVLVGHSPTAKDSVEVRRSWWQGISAALRKAPASCIPLVLLDANAQEKSVHARRWEDSNDAFFKHFLSEHQLLHSGDSRDVDEQGRSFTTWRSPEGVEACIDFLCYPRDVASGVAVEGPLPGFQGLLEHDHRPIAARCRWTRFAKVLQAQVRLDLTFLDTEAGRRRYSQLLTTLPPIQWLTDVDTHLEQVHGHIHLCLRAVCPPLKKLARSPVTSARTWELIRSRRDLRRELHAATRAGRAGLLRCCFQAWQSGSATVSDDHLAGLHSALLVQQLWAHNRLIRDSARQDAAAATKHIFDTAHDQGLEALHRLFRSVVKAGGKYCKPCLAPAILQSDGSVAADYIRLRILGDHFAESERAAQTLPQDISTSALAVPDGPLQAVPELSLPVLAQAFGRLARKKACGLSAVPAEALRAAPVSAAHCFSSLLLKMQIRGQTPALWRGGQAVAIEKPSKPLGQLSSWRSILLLEARATGVARAIRPCLLKSFDRLRCEGQGGSRPRGPIQSPIAICRGFLRRLRRDRLSGGVVFVDSASAFYSVLRQTRGCVGARAGSKAPVDLSRGGHLPRSSA